jgi:glycerate dehydrogenase
MDKTKIVFLDAYTNNPGDISFDCISGLGQLDVYQRTEPSEVAERASDAEILIVNKFVINEEILGLLPNLKYIVVAATGYNNIDLESVRQRNIPVSNVRGYSTESVTQHVFASLLAIKNRIEYYDGQVKIGRWVNSPDFCFYDHPIQELDGLTMGILGYGTIGKRVGQVASAFGMNVIAHTRNTDQPTPDYLEFVDMETLFHKADVLSLHCPLMEETTQIINKVSLKKMKPTAILINTGRGGLINENDLFYALDHGIISGAALDVLVNEPPLIHNPLINHIRCIVTPHIAWASQNARKRLLDGIAENIRSYYNGQVINRV